MTSHEIVLETSSRGVGAKRFFGFFSLALVLLYSAFSSVLFIPYAHHDQLRYFFQEFSAPHLDNKILSPTKIVQFRIFHAGSALALLGVAWAGLFWIRKIFAREDMAAGWIALLAVTGLAGANFITVKNVWNSNLEAMYVRNAVLHFGTESLRRIHVVKPVANGTGFNGLPSVGDDFNCKTSQFPEVPDLVRASLVGVDIRQKYVVDCYGSQERCISLGSPKPEILLVTVSLPGEPVFRTPGTLVIDMNHLIESMRTLK